MILIIFIGIQGSGKSTFYEKNFKNTFVRVNLDELKTRNREKILFKTSLLKKENIVIDNTNPTVADRERYIKPAKDMEYEIHGYYFNADLERSLKRNASRSRVVPKVGILGTLNKLERPSYAEGFDKLFFVKIDQNNKFIVEDWKL
jgi:predicted kinase